MVGAVLSPRQDVIHIHHPEREVGVAADAYAFLHAVEAVAVGAVVWELALVGALWWLFLHRGAAPESLVVGYAVVHQLDG